MRQAFVHPRLHQRLRKGEVATESRPEERLRQRQILRHLVTHHRVRADPLVRLAPHHDELPVGDDIAGPPRPVHRPRMVPHAEEEPHLGHDHALPERLAPLVRRDRQQISALLLERRHRMGKQIGGVTGVGIGEDEHLPSRGARALHAGPRLAEPAIGQCVALDQPDARIGGGECRGLRRGVVGGSVVHDDDLERLIGAGAERADHRGKGARFVAGGMMTLRSGPR